MITVWKPKCGFSKSIQDNNIYSASHMLKDCFIEFVCKDGEGVRIHPIHPKKDSSNHPHPPLAAILSRSEENGQLDSKIKDTVTPA